jgi:hypothetical protein
MKKKSGQPPPTKEDRQFKDLLRRIAAVPKEEVAEREREYRLSRDEDSVRPGRKKRS